MRGEGTPITGTADCCARAAAGHATTSAERLGGLEVDCQLVFRGRPEPAQVGRLYLEDAIDVAGRAQVDPSAPDGPLYWSY